MKILCSLMPCFIIAVSTYGQVGIGTTSPNSTLDVRGSFSSNYRSFTSATTASSTDNKLVFVGTTAATLSLPDATTCSGRIYWIKNASITIPTPSLIIANASAQTIDGVPSLTLNEPMEIVTVVSNGTNWDIINRDVPFATTGANWYQGGNSITAPKSLGTITNYDLPFITNNIERMRIDISGRVGIGNANPTTLLHVSSNEPNSAPFTVARFEGLVDPGSDLNMQLINTSSSNSKTFLLFGGSSLGKQWCIGNDLDGDNKQNFYIYDFNGTGPRLFIDSVGNTGIATASPNSTLDIRGSLSLNYRSFTSYTTALSTDNTLTFTGASATTLMLPNAITCTGRLYSIKNASTTVPTPVLTIATQSGQTIDGNASRLLNQSKEMITVMSNGTNWIIISHGTLTGQPSCTVSSSLNQSVSTTTTSALITFETNEVLNSITHSTTVNPSRITVPVNGAYSISFSAVVGGGDGIIDIWLRKNGTDVPRTNCPTTSLGTGILRLTATFVVNAVANDYFELVQASTNIAAGLRGNTAQINPIRPATPSIILTVNKLGD